MSVPFSDLRSGRPTGGQVRGIVDGEEVDMRWPALEGALVVLSVALVAGGCPSDHDPCADHDAQAPILDEWQVIGPGSFEMGSDAGDAREQPVHTVAMDSFLMWRTEVTVAQYARCYCEGACEEPYIDAEPEVQNWDVPGREQHPVNYTPWDQAVAWCDWIEGRLPSEAEWEYAARGEGQPIDYPWGDAPATCDAAVMNDAEHEAGCGDEHTGEVCSRVEGNSDQALCDMAGNVREWVQDEFHADYGGAPGHGAAWGSADGATGIQRGGSFVDDHLDLRATARAAAESADGTYTAGFRCVR
jgi:formylglycine-generating enzyme required for sulfatase activity